MSRTAVRRHRLPLFTSLAGYGRSELRADAVAGLTTSVMLVPQAMAYALLAGLPPIMGLYAALIPPVVYALLGTSRQLSVGPVAMDSLLLAAGVGAIYESGTDQYLAAAVLLAVMVGTLQMLLGLLKMGILVNFLSLPVISGFTSAAAILIGLSQLKHLLGVPLASSPTAWGLMRQVPGHLGAISYPTLLLGALSVGLLVALKKWLPKLPGPLLVVSAATLLVALGGLSPSIGILGDVPSGFPPFALPSFDLHLMSELLPTALSIALVAFMESIAVAKTYASKNKYALSANQELIALGAANAVGGMFAGYPVAGGFSRTAVNAQAGARSQVATLLTSLFVGIALFFLTPAFYFLPKVALSAMIITAVAGLIDSSEVRRLGRIKRSDLVLLGLTFFATLLLGAPSGLGLGVLASLAWLVARSLRPHLAVVGRVPGTTQFRNVLRYKGLVTYEGILIVRMDAQFYFGNVAFLKDSLAELERDMNEPLRALILDASAINAIDSSGEAALRDLIDEHESRDVKFYLAAVKGPVRDVLSQSGLEQRLGSAGRCLSVYEALVQLGAVGRSGRLGPTDTGALVEQPAPGAPSASARL